MLTDEQFKEYFARRTTISYPMAEHDCCKIEHGVETLICPINWEGNFVPREFIEMTQAFYSTKIY